jgi:hypothetical protein
MQVRRLSTNPIITPALDKSIGANVNGPSLLRVPDWLPNPLGRYYLYFAHHQGVSIRLAYADALTGPWTIYSPGTLRLEQTPCYNHIASPDLHIDHENRRILMYYHGPFVRPEELEWDPLKRKYPFLEGQRSLLAVSEDGLSFTSDTEILGPSYFRVFRYPNSAESWTYALAMPGILFRSRDGRTNFEPGPVLFARDQRHTALLLSNDILYVFYSRAGDCPEHILCATIDLRPDWGEWKSSAPFSILEPETDYEGVNLPLEPSQRGAIHKPARQLRDPGIYQEGDQVYLLYSIAGESGIALAELQLN